MLLGHRYGIITSMNIVPVRELETRTVPVEDTKEQTLIRGVLWVDSVMLEKLYMNSKLVFPEFPLAVTGNSPDRKVQLTELFNMGLVRTSTVADESNDSAVYWFGTDKLVSYLDSRGWQDNS